MQVCKSIKQNMTKQARPVSEQERPVATEMTRLHNFNLQTEEERQKPQNRLKHPEAASTRPRWANKGRQFSTEGEGPEPNNKVRYWYTIKAKWDTQPSRQSEIHNVKAVSPAHKQSL